MESKQLRHLKWVYFAICFLYISGATFIVQLDWFLFGTAILASVIASAKRIRLDNSIIFVFLIFAFINIFSVLFNGYDLSFPAVVGFYLRIFIAYILIKSFDSDFFVYYEKVLYYAALVSLPLFSIELINPHFFTTYLSSINLSGELRESVGYWNGLIYTTHELGSTGNGIVRNDGFAIEPGHFGFLLGIAIFYNLLNNKFRLNKRLFVMIFAGLTTISSAFYLTLVFFLFFYFLNVKTSLFARFILFALVVGVNFYITTSEVVVEKIERTTNVSNAQFLYGVDNIEVGNSMNRIGAIKIALHNFVKYPLGYGLNLGGRARGRDGELILGPNGLGTIITVWGIFGIVILYRAIVLFRRKIDFEYRNTKGLYLFSIIFLIYLFSNAISKDILVFILILYPFIRTKHIVNHKISMGGNSKRFV